MFTVKYQCAFYVKNYENSFKNSIPDSFPFLLDRAFYPLLHQKNSSIHYIHRYIFQRPLHSWWKQFKTFSGYSHFQGVLMQFPFDNMEDIFNWVEIWTTYCYCKLSCPNLLSSSSGFCTVLWWTTIL